MSTATLTLAAPPANSQAGYFQKPITTTLILGAFVFLTVPMAWMVLFQPVMGLVWLYLWLFGMTHFVLTFTVYLQSNNLRHFTNSPKNILIFFVVPLGIFAFFDFYQVLQVAVLFPIVNLVFRSLIRLVDFFHFSRQSFGVLQLFKAESGCEYPKWLKRAENLFLLGLTGLLQCTFLEGVRCLAGTGSPEEAVKFGAYFPLLKPIDAEDVWSIVLNIASWLLLAGTLALFIAVLVGYHRAERKGGSVGKSILYLLAQTASGCLAIVYLPLYLATLAIHYVEYHVVMAPRCFHTPLNPESRLDRWFADLRRRPFVFYAAIIAAAGIITLIVRQSMDTMIPGSGEMGRSMSYLLLISIFDGIFVFHYFVEAFIWKFSDPFFRQSMAGLYFPAPKR